MFCLPADISNLHNLVGFGAPWARLVYIRPLALMTRCHLDERIHSVHFRRNNRNPWQSTDSLYFAASFELHLSSPSAARPRLSLLPLYKSLPATLSITNGKLYSRRPLSILMKKRLQCAYYNPGQSSLYFFSFSLILLHYMSERFSVLLQPQPIRPMT